MRIEVTVLYSPDLNPCDFDGIARIKRPNKNKRFANEVQLQAEYEEVIGEINLQNSATVIRHLLLRWPLSTRPEANIFIRYIIIILPLNILLKI